MHDARVAFAEAYLTRSSARISYRGVRLESPKSLRKLITATPALDAVAIDKLAHSGYGVPGEVEPRGRR